MSDQHRKNNIAYLTATRGKDNKMKLHILVTDDKRKRTSKAKTPKKAKTAKATKPAKTDKRKAQQAYWAKRKAQEKKQAKAPAGGNNEEKK